MKKDKSNYMAVQLTGQTVLKKPGDIAGQQFIMDNLKQCKVKVLDHVEQVTIDDCDDCEIVIGPAESSVFVRDCKNCTFHVMCQQLRTR
jgi:protein XRP2